ncbi:MAG: prepilin-type N-terminal cleavage/methylation domain-containing protein [Candidatus Pacebacteria bacterium]|nr:prepilin-type N-terminal cleavage/methylation domain-containing protein [Candidatus Paceibacterota bacterium]
MKYTVEMINFIRLKIRNIFIKKIQGIKAFTLVELVVVIGILTILATVTLLVINPTELNRQARDSQRLSDLQTINSALGLFQSYNLTLTGTANTVYTSLSSNTADCSDLGLPALPAGWSYACVTANNLRKIDGTGWIPVDFTQVQTNSGSLFAALPIDPTNTATGDFYYTYVKGSWALSAKIESTKFLTNAQNDGGATTTRFEVGGGGAIVTDNAWTVAVVADPTCSDSTKNQDETDVDCGGDVCDACANGLVCVDNADCTSNTCTAGVCTAAPIACGAGDTTGMVSYWNGDSTVADVMGTNNGTDMGAVAYAAGKVGNAFNFNNTSNNGVTITTTGFPMGNSSRSIEAWVNFNSCTGALNPLVYGTAGYKTYSSSPQPSCTSGHLGYSGYNFEYHKTSLTFTPGTWYHIVTTFNGTTLKVYKDGYLVGESNVTDYDPISGPGSALSGMNTTSGAEHFLGHVNWWGYWDDGKEDEIAIYNEVLSDGGCTIGGDICGGDIGDHYARGVAGNPYCPYTP